MNMAGKIQEIHTELLREKNSQMKIHFIYMCCNGIMDSCFIFKNIPIPTQSQC